MIHLRRAQLLGNGFAALAVCAALGALPSAAAKPNCRYQPNGKDADGNEVVWDKKTNLDWQNAVGTVATWDKATCPTDFRLPSVLELFTLVKLTNATNQPTIDLEAFKGSDNGGPFWTSVPGTNDSHFYVSFDTGNVVVGPLSATAKVRCVRPHPTK